ncbi:MAG: type II toxin-antitoxin system VapC family toxin [Verrucomicrobia bacterium]|nr:type II toxin-antitoxin system VapC family toxin [Verrucomicrobiota bacterium]
MRHVFADTGYWIAILNPRDQLHERAKSESARLRQDRVILVTTEMILVEFANYYAERGAWFRQQAALAIQSIQREPNLRLVEQTRVLFRNALVLYHSRLDKKWSFTDCASILVMQDYKIDAILAHDIHFEQAGFTTLLRG